MTTTPHDPLGWHGTTILCVRKDGRVAMAGDGQVSLGPTVVKGNARKVRRIAAGVLVGFAGANRPDAFTPLERLEAGLERFDQLERAAVELAKDWRDRPLPAAAGGAASGGGCQPPAAYHRAGGC